MRVLGAILGLSLLIVPMAALGQAAKPAPAATKKPAAQGPAQVYAALPANERMQIQSDLVWAGHYQGLVDGNFGETSITAVKAFQTHLGNKATGILNPQERIDLAAAAKKAQTEAGWKVVDDPVTGARIGVPLKRTPQAIAGKDGTKWSGPQATVVIETFRLREPGTTLAKAFDQAKKEPSGRKPEYSVMRNDFFVVSGLQGLKKFYVRGEFKNGQVRGYTLMYDLAMEGIMTPIVVAMSSAFEGFPTGAAADAARKRVEYATGVVVSTGGYLITDRQAIDGCIALLVGSVDAERIAEDKSADIALVHVNGLADLVPLALATGSASTDLRLVGIADPQMQDGGGAVSLMDAKLGANQALSPAPPAGFSGAAAIDPQHRLAGIVQIRSAAVASTTPSVPVQAMLVPAATLSALLTANKVTPAGAAAGDGKASVVRLICVRK